MFCVKNITPPSPVFKAFIKLGQAIKLAGMVDSGVEAKIVITDGEVEVNGEVECRRGKKLHNGDIVSFRGETIKIVG